jgi:hypothetical protein
LELLDLISENRIPTLLIAFGSICVLSYFFDEIAGFTPRKQARRSLVALGAVLTVSGAILGLIKDPPPRPLSHETPRELKPTVTPSADQSSSDPTPMPTGTPSVPTPTPSPFPVYVSYDMVVDCQTRGGRDKCSYPGVKTVLGGQPHNRGVVFTQSLPQTAYATIRIPTGARSFAFSVGNYWTGGNCGGQRPMQMKITVDGAPKWTGDVSTIRSDEISLPPESRFLDLRGDSGDEDGRCDDAVWVDARFR